MSAFITQAIRYMYQHIDEAITLDDIAKHCHISVSSLKRQFNTKLAISPAAFLRKLRMEIAYTQLQTQEDTVLNIALGNGFSDHSAFSRSFKASFGLTPNQAKVKRNIISDLESIELTEPDFIEQNFCGAWLY